jgi:hypothetical protein
LAKQGDDTAAPATRPWPPLAWGQQERDSLSLVPGEPH